MNAGKTGHTADTFDQEQLDTLVGNKVVFYEEDEKFGDVDHFGRPYLDSTFADQTWIGGL